MSFDRVAVEPPRPVGNPVQTFTVARDGRCEILLPYDVAQADMNDRNALDWFLIGNVDEKRTVFHIRDIYEEWFRKLHLAGGKVKSEKAAVAAGL